MGPNEIRWINAVKALGRGIDQHSAQMKRLLQDIRFNTKEINSDLNKDPLKNFEALVGLKFQEIQSAYAELIVYLKSPPEKKESK